MTTCPPPASESLARSIVHAVILNLLAWVVLFLNPFDVNNWTANESRDTYFLLTSPLYRIGAQTEAVVVLVGDPTLEAAGETFPPSFTLVGDLLRGLADRGAAAVFLDLEFIDRRPGEERFARLLESFARQDGMPVLLASGMRPGGRCEESETILPGLRHTGVYRAAISFALDLPDGGYQPVVDVGCPEKRLSAAWAMYELRRGVPLDRLGVGIPQDALPPDRMAVRWGADPAPVTWRLDPEAAERCRPRPENVWQALLRTGELVVNALTRPSSGGTGRECPANYIPVVSGRYLLPGAPIAGERADALRAAIEGKYVFVGGAYDGIPDFAPSPVHGPVRGVLLHAMAFENFVGAGRDVIVPWGVSPFGATWDQLLMAVLVFSGTLVSRRNRERCLLWLLLGTATLGLLVLFLVECLRCDPVNWVAILGIYAFQPTVQARIETLLACLADRLSCVARALGRFGRTLAIALVEALKRTTRMTNHLIRRALQAIPLNRKEAS
jgi:CHASE2 domain-containing sensor protein